MVLTGKPIKNKKKMTYYEKQVSDIGTGYYQFDDDGTIITSFVATPVSKSFIIPAPDMQPPVEEEEFRGTEPNPIEESDFIRQLEKLATLLGKELA
jgi:hypothetical protein